MKIIAWKMGQKLNLILSHTPLTQIYFILEKKWSFHFSAFLSTSPFFFVNPSVTYVLYCKSLSQERGSRVGSLPTDEDVRPADFIHPKTWRETECAGTGNAKAALLPVPGIPRDGRRRQEIVYPTPRGSSDIHASRLQVCPRDISFQISKMATIESEIKYYLQYGINLRLYSLVA